MYICGANFSHEYSRKNGSSLVRIVIVKVATITRQESWSLAGGPCSRLDIYINSPFGCPPSTYFRRFVITREHGVHYFFFFLYIYVYLYGVFHPDAMLRYRAVDFPCYYYGDFPRTSAHSEGGGKIQRGYSQKVGKIFLCTLRCTLLNAKKMSRYKNYHYFKRRREAFIQMYCRSDLL